MTDYERILVPVDFSTHSGEATRVAADLAKRFNSSLTLVYVYDPLAYSLPDGFATCPRGLNTISPLDSNFKVSPRLT